jgi:hypothetical protein
VETATLTDAAEAIELSPVHGKGTGAEDMSTTGQGLFNVSLQRGIGSQKAADIPLEQKGVDAGREIHRGIFDVRATGNEKTGDGDPGGNGVHQVAARCRGYQGKGELGHRLFFLFQG